MKKTTLPQFAALAHLNCEMPMYFVTRRPEQKLLSRDPIRRRGGAAAISAIAISQGEKVSVTEEIF